MSIHVTDDHPLFSSELPLNAINIIRAVLMINDHDENINLSLVTISRQEGVFDDKQTPIGSKLQLSSSFEVLSQVMILKNV